MKVLNVRVRYISVDLPGSPGSLGVNDVTKLGASDLCKLSSHIQMRSEHVYKIVNVISVADTC